MSFCTVFSRAIGESGSYFGLDAESVNRDEARKEDSMLCCDAEAPRLACREAAAERVGSDPRAQHDAHRDPRPAAGGPRFRALFSRRPRRVSAAPGLTPAC
jgi:hypothetical protein